MSSGGVAMPAPSYLQDLRSRTDAALQVQRTWSLGRVEPITVHFGPGFLGLGFGLSTDVTYSARIQDLPTLPDGTAGAAALYNASTIEAAKRLVPGLLLTHINDADMSNLAYVDTLERIQAVGRPVKLRFAAPKLRAAASEVEVSQDGSNAVALRAFEAVQQGHFLVLLELWPAIDMQSRHPSDMRSLLHVAARYKNDAVVAWLLEQPHGADLARARNAQGRLPLHDAMSGGVLSICERLLATYPDALTIGDDRGVLCVHLAAGNGHVHLFPWLVRHDAPLHSTSVDGKTALHYACAQGHLEVVIFLLKHGGSVSAVDIHQCNCLHYTALHGHLDLAQWLVFQTPIPLTQRNAKRLLPCDMVPAGNDELKEFLELVSAEPLPPCGLHAADVQATLVRLAWSVDAVPLEFRCTEVATLELEYGRAYIGGWEPYPVRLDATATSCVVPELQPNTEYSFRLRAWNENGSSSFVKITARTLPATSADSLTVVRLVGAEARHLPLTHASHRFYMTLCASPGHCVRSGFGRLQPAFGHDVDAYRHPQWSLSLPVVVSEPTELRVAVYGVADDGPYLVGRATAALQREMPRSVWRRLDNDANEGTVALLFDTTDDAGDAVDQYGFVVPPVHVRAYRYASALADCTEIYRQAAWATTANVDGHGAWHDISHVDDPTALEALAWSGVPRDLRRHVYFIGGRAATMQAAAGAGYYAQLVAVDKNTIRDHHLIASDVQRTFADQPRMQSVRPRLERLLLAFVAHAPSLGYCQSMNYLGARLLTLYANESEDDERAFWVFASLCHEKFPTYYNAGLDGLHTDGAVLERLLRSRLPRLSAHCRSLKTPMPLLAAQWFLPLFCQTLPTETTYRLLDVIVLQRSTTVVFALVLAHLRLAAPRLLATHDYMDFTAEVRHVEAGLYDVDPLLEMAAKEHFGLGDDATLLRASEG
ncbi:hypothetical protein, variant [Saprolegnia diclina VS20]|uniref:Fibronectin type-III domain-containing protein n=1 Tax=Saprolegnia diclina (strain VS20) TaxID=1156394 RepID=T0RPR1_SAPDV|nr:hypothetical protein, variant [Saprolegnia diclina VS20]EQC31957.1 hypothetical protein, variant [Saprolegnia diclina VS20]|eukprot:XP_008614684.1 hypothetical protein, variant [Saprolegnia diclina VS20]